MLAERGCPAPTPSPRSAPLCRRSSCSRRRCVIAAPVPAPCADAALGSSSSRSSLGLAPAPADLLRADARRAACPADRRAGQSTSHVSARPAPPGGVGGLPAGPGHASLPWEYLKYEAPSAERPLVPSASSGLDLLIVVDGEADGRGGPWGGPLQPFIVYLMVNVAVMTASSAILLL
jgi:hypothetical protein